MKLRIISGEITRPANTTAYSAGQVIANATGYPHIVLANVFRKKAATGYAPTGVDFNGWVSRIIDMTDNVSGSARHRLHFFRATSAAVAALADGTAFPELYTESANYLGSIDLPAPRTGGAGSTAVTREVKDLTHAIQAGPLNSVVVVRVTLDATTPASGQKYSAQFAIIQE